MTNIKLPSKSSVYKQIKDCGVGKAILNRVLPEWWDDQLLNSNSGFIQFSKILKQKLGIATSIAPNGSITFEPSDFSVQYKKRTNTDIEQLTDATFLCQAVGNTIINVLRYNERVQDINGIHSLLNSSSELSLDAVLPYFWSCNVPVIHVDRFPAGISRPAGVVIREHDMYAIILGHKHKSPSTQLFVLLHEMGHIINGHLPISGALMDTSLPEFGESLQDESDQQENEADDYALSILRKGSDVTSIVRQTGRLSRPAELAIKAKKVSAELGVSAGHFVLTYGRETRDWPLTQQALKFIENGDAQLSLTSSFSEAIAGFELKQDDIDFLQMMQSL